MTTQIPQELPFLVNNEAQIAIRAGIEGVPVKAISRILGKSFDAVYETLRMATDTGALIALPKSEWPEGTDRAPTSSVSADADLQFMLQQRMRLTKLEAGFMVVLLRSERVDKTKLHRVVEHHRLSRATRPNSLEPTDPKMVDVMICKMRKKLINLHERFVITTIWGTGYAVEAAAREAIFSWLGISPAGKAPARGAAQTPPASGGAPADPALASA